MSIVSKQAGNTSSKATEKTKVSGVILVDKPKGMTSQQVVSKVKYLFKSPIHDSKKAGHTGTLDPMATGLLPVCLGEATKFSHYQLDADKSYQATILLGSQTDTGDAEGQMVAQASIPAFDDEALNAVARQFLGTQQQIPPMYSALKKDGKKLYEYARAGIEVDRPPRDITIKSINLKAVDDSHILLTVTCTKGTYVRVLAEDIAKRLDTLGHLTALRRTQVGNFNISDAIGLSTLEESDLDKRQLQLLPVDACIDIDAELTLTNEQCERVHMGQRLYGKVRALTDENGQRIKSAGPSIPVEILGLPETPAAGSEFLVVTDEKKAREVADFRTNRERERQLERQNAMRLESMFDQMGQGDVSFLNIVLKTDVRGSLEALLAALNELSTDEVKVRVISSGVGPISESDVTLAESSEAVLLGFNVRADATARRKADTANMDIRYYSVIYGLIDDVKSAMSGMLAPEHREKILGVAEVREVFRSSKFGAAAGCMVVEGTIYRNKPIRVLRDDKVIFTGQLQSLRRYKEDVNEVRTGIECGLAVRGYDVEAGDKIEVFEIQEFARTI